MPSLAALPVRGRGTEWEERQILHRVTNLPVSRSVLERHAIAGNSPVCENCADSDSISRVTPDPGKPV